MLTIAGTAVLVGATILTFEAHQSPPAQPLSGLSANVLIVAEASQHALRPCAELGAWSAIAIEGGRDGSYALAMQDASITGYVSHPVRRVNFISPGSPAAPRVVLPMCSDVQAIAGGEEVVVVCRSNDAALPVVVSKGQPLRELPRSPSCGEHRPTAAAQKPGWLAVGCGDRLLVLDTRINRWAAVGIGYLPGANLHIAIREQFAYVALDKGEWGGKVLRVDLASGKSERIGLRGSPPVTAFAESDAGLLTLAAGLPMAAINVLPSGSIEGRFIWASFQLTPELSRFLRLHDAGDTFEPPFDGATPVIPHLDGVMAMMIRNDELYLASTDFGLTRHSTQGWQVVAPALCTGPDGGAQWVDVGAMHFESAESILAASEYGIFRVYLDGEVEAIRMHE